MIAVAISSDPSSTPAIPTTRNKVKLLFFQKGVDEGAVSGVLSAATEEVSLPGPLKVDVKMDCDVCSELDARVLIHVVAQNETAEIVAELVENPGVAVVILFMLVAPMVGHVLVDVVK
eukprot:Em0014g934a